MLKKFAWSFRRAAAGQQYAIVVGLIAVIAIAAISQLGASLGRLMTGVGNRLTSVDNLSSGSSQAAPSGNAMIVDRGDGVRRWSDGTAAASCNDYRNPSGNYNYAGLIGDGLYQIASSPYALNYVKCDMTTDGGGWQAFYSGLNGYPNRFAYFESTAESCSNVSNHCLRRLPAATSTANVIAARCGSAMVKFNINAATLGLFRDGVQGTGWQATSNVVAIAGTVPNLPSFIWTGQTTNTSFILGTQTQNQTFLDSYYQNNGWDYCNSVSDTTSAIDLYFR